VIDGLEATRVIVDDHEGARKAVDYLIKTGCKRIAYIGGPGHLYISRQRKEGYIDALTKNNLPVDESLIIHCHELKKEPTEACKELLNRKDRPDAIFCMHDPIAIQAIQVAKSMNIKIPDELSVVGFTNEPVSQYIEPSITTMAQPSYEMGRVAAKLFLQQMEDKEAFQPVTEVIETQLIIRNSTRKL
jgi:DNA-binding LacI/PurR family transcriptional regulator